MNKVVLARRRATALGAAALAASVAIAACSSGGSGGSSSGNPAGSATKSPFTFYVETAPLVAADNLAGVKAAVAAINAAGGVNGHPLSYSPCSDNLDPNQALTCARQGASNPSVLAFVDQGSPYGAEFDPVFQQSGIA